MNSKNFDVRVFCAWIVFLGIAINDARAINPVDYTLNFGYSVNTIPVTTRAWVPDTTQPLKGVYVGIPGSDNDTRGPASNSLWQYQLAQMGFGYVGFHDVANFPVLAGDSSAQSHANLQLVLDRMATSFNHPELRNAPIILDGISKGGYNVSQLGPELADRTICYIADKGYAAGIASEQDLQVPGIAVAGFHDVLVPAAQVQFSFTTSRTEDAKLAQLVDWNIGHIETSTTTKLAFIDQVMRVRYPKNQRPSVTPNTPFSLVDVSHLAGAWLGEANQLTDDIIAFVPIASPIITPESLYPGDPSGASWLPTQAMAMVYKAHNDASFNSRPIQLNVVTPFNGHVVMNISTTQIVSNTLRLYHNEELIATLDPSMGPIRFTYDAKENGLHTFIAVADYLSNGVLKQTSNYTATVVSGVVTVPEPVTAVLIVVCVTLGVQVRRFRQIDQ